MGTANVISRVEDVILVPILDGGQNTLDVAYCAGTVPRSSAVDAESTSHASERRGSERNLDELHGAGKCFEEVSVIGEVLDLGEVSGDED